MWHLFVPLPHGYRRAAAAETIQSRDDDAEIVVVGAEPHGYYSRPGLAYYQAKEAPEARLFPFTAQDIAHLNVRLLHERVVHLDPASRTRQSTRAGCPDL